MLDAIEAVIEARREFWPLSDRQIHYALLSDPPLRHAAKPYSRYQNDRDSYNNLTDLVTRARLERRIPFEAIGDETRPIEEWQVYPGVSAFVRDQMEHVPWLLAEPHAEPAEPSGDRRREKYDPFDCGARG